MSRPHSEHDRGSTQYELSLANRAPVVLVAEDDSMLRRLMVSTLRRDGFKVIEAVDGGALEGWIRRVFEEHADRQSIDLIISDQRMPTASGFEVLARLRRANWSTPFILVTAFSDPGTREEAARLGAATVLDKPFDLADLRTAALHFASPDAS